jgi:hypothetical protein
MVHFAGRLQTKLTLAEYRHEVGTLSAMLCPKSGVSRSCGGVGE